jgi:pimeloyl-ACP methyl ester carboxylesterase
MEYLIGAGLALGVSLFARLTGFDRDRVFYPAVLVVIASYYDLFAAVGDGAGSLGSETAAFAVFAALSVIGFRTNLWIIAAALLAHGLFDLVHGRVIGNAGVPASWPMFCLSFDAVASACLGWLLLSGRISARNRCSYAAHIRPYVNAELLAAQAADASDPPRAFHHLERAHVLGQSSTTEHVRVHYQMLAWGIRHKAPREIAGQIPRLFAAATKTPFGLVPHGNTGGANVSPFRPMPIASDLAATIAAARMAAGSLLALVVLGIAACAASPADAQTAVVDGRHIAYRVMGSGGPAVVMISGLGFGMSTFDQVAPELAKHATVIIYDRPGYGASEAPSGDTDAIAAERDLSAVLAQSGARGPYILAGHSLGGLFAEYYAAKHPDQVSGLILEESRPADFGRRCEAQQIPMCSPTVEMMKSQPKGVQAEVAGLAATVAEVEQVGPVQGKRVLVLSRPEVKGATPFVTLWAQAQDDLAARYPGSQHLRPPGGGHDIHHDQRDWFMSVVTDFLLHRVEPASR